MPKKKKGFKSMVAKKVVGEKKVLKDIETNMMRYLHMKTHTIFSESIKTALTYTKTKEGYQRSVLFVMLCHNYKIMN